MLPLGARARWIFQRGGGRGGGGLGVTRCNIQGTLLIHILMLTPLTESI